MQETEKRALTMEMLEVFSRFRRMQWNNSHGHPIFHREMILFHCIAENAPDQQRGLTVSDLSHRLGVKPPTVTNMLNMLESRGLVERSMDPDDRRSVLVRLTPDGQALADQGMTRILDKMSGLVEYLGAEDARQLVALMSKTFDYFISRQDTGREEHPGREPFRRHPHPFHERNDDNPC